MRETIGKEHRILVKDHSSILILWRIVFLICVSGDIITTVQTEVVGNA